MILRGRILAVEGAMLLARLPRAACADMVRIGTARSALYGRVAAVRDGSVTIAALGSTTGVRVGDRVEFDPCAPRTALGTVLLGRAVDAGGASLDGVPAPAPCRPRSQRSGCAPRPDARVAICCPLWTGVRAIDGLLAIGRGARAGIFGGPGLGKSQLLRRIVRDVQADAVVVALVGERGREAAAWIAQLDARMTICVATGDRPAAERVEAARVAFAQAAALRGRGLDVLLVVDSLARIGAALREGAVARGESAGRGGYPPSVFAELAALVEGAGRTCEGSVTLLATVLSDGDDRDPLSEAARSLLDGHLQLSARRAAAGRFPAIDVLGSASRTMAEVVTDEQSEAAARVRAALAWLERTAEARELGILPGEAWAQRVLAHEPALEAFLGQDDQASAPEQTLVQLHELADRLGEAL
ncbi:MAG: EscN/YscN/HrcN family type III secretion system ATPase [Vulcanimicrobiaceae bacterium]